MVMKAEKFSVPLYQPELNGLEKKLVVNCLDTNWISSKGQYVEEFEGAFGKYIDLKHCRTSCNGTAAVHLCLLALGLGPGDEVLVPTFTYIASVNPILYVGAKPVFLESNFNSLQVDVDKIESKISSRTRAILVPHLYGNVCDIERVAIIAKKRGLFLIEDCAEALGTYYDNSHVGKFGDIAAFSFFANKTITTGEGGMVATNDPKLARLVERFRGQGLSSHTEYWHDILGFNYRMTNIQAAIGLAQLKTIKQKLAGKVRLNEYYKKELKNLPIRFPLISSNVTCSHWLNVIFTKTPETRSRLRSYLSETGVETRPTFPPVHSMPIYGSESDFPVSEVIANTGVCLPSWPGLTKKQRSFVVSQIKQFFNFMDESVFNPYELCQSRTRECDMPVAVNMLQAKSRGISRWPN